MTNIRLTSEQAFERAEQIRADWASGKYQSIVALSSAYVLSNVYVKKILDGEKCVRKEPPKGKWKPIRLNGINFLVSSDGRVWSVSQNKLIAQNKSKRGYYKIKISHEGVQRKYTVHRLVLTLFDRKSKKGEVGRHLDDDKSNNDISNLSWGTVQDNANDAIFNNRQVRGTDIHTSVLTDALAVELITGYKTGALESYAEKFRAKHKLDINLRQLVLVLKGKYWTHVVPGFTGYAAAWQQKLDDAAVHALHKNWKQRGHLYRSKTKFYEAFAAFLSSRGYTVDWKTLRKAHNGDSFRKIHAMYET